MKDLQDSAESSPMPADLDIKAQCDLLCASRSFRVSQRRLRLLRHLVERTLPDIAGMTAALGVRFFLDGSVQRSKGRVRVRARLYDVKRNRETWSGRFERSLGTADLLDLQDDVAQEVVAHSADVFSGALGRSLRCELGRSELGGEASSDIRVYEGILRFHQYLHCLGRQGSHHEAQRSLKRLFALRPDFAERGRCYLSCVLAEDSLEVGSFLTFTLGIIVLFVGKRLNGRVGFLREFSIPEPVTGGLPTDQ